MACGGVAHLWGGSRRQNPQELRELEAREVGSFGKGLSDGQGCMIITDEGLRYSQKFCVRLTCRQM
jgi:hypothetical protein